MQCPLPFRHLHWWFDMKFKVMEHFFRGLFSILRLILGLHQFPDALYWLDLDLPEKLYLNNLPSAAVHFAMQCQWHQLFHSYTQVSLGMSDTKWQPSWILHIISVQPCNALSVHTKKWTDEGICTCIDLYIIYLHDFVCVCVRCCHSWCVPGFRFHHDAFLCSGLGSGTDSGGRRHLLFTYSGHSVMAWVWWVHTWSSSVCVRVWWEEGGGVGT